MGAVVSGRVAAHGSLGRPSRAPGLAEEAATTREELHERMGLRYRILTASQELIATPRDVESSRIKAYHCRGRALAAWSGTRPTESHHLLSTTTGHGSGVRLGHHYTSARQERNVSAIGGSACDMWPTWARHVLRPLRPQHWCQLRGWKTTTVSRKRYRSRLSMLRSKTVRAQS